MIGDSLSFAFHPELSLRKKQNQYIELPTEELAK
jgi:hypothetical protein